MSDAGLDDFEPTSEEVDWQGQIIRVGTQRFRYADGEEVAREKVWHPGAVGILAVDAQHVWLTRQPREVVGLIDSLEIPAGKLDVEGEAPLDCARRELVEEIGKEAEDWLELVSFFSSPGFTDERVTVYLATGLRDAPGGAAPDEGERIEIVKWPRDRLQDALQICQDAKSLVALNWLLAQGPDALTG